MATKKKTATKKTTKAKSAADVVKKTPAKKKAKPKEKMRTFAIRVTDEELAAIHKAAGPRNASRFMRAVAAAFANADEGTFKKALKEAEAARVNAL